MELTRKTELKAEAKITKKQASQNAPAVLANIPVTRLKPTSENGAKAAQDNISNPSRRDC